MPYGWNDGGTSGLDTIYVPGWDFSSQIFSYIPSFLQGNYFNLFFPGSYGGGGTGYSFDYSDYPPPDAVSTAVYAAPQYPVYIPPYHEPETTRVYDPHIETIVSTAPIYVPPPPPPVTVWTPSYTPQPPTIYIPPPPIYSPPPDAVSTAVYAAPQYPVYTPPYHEPETTRVYDPRIETIVSTAPIITPYVPVTFDTANFIAVSVPGSGSGGGSFGVSGATSVSPALINMVKVFEGFTATPKKDRDGYSIGFGHWEKSFPPNTVWTREDADRQLNIDLAKVDSAIDRLVTVPLTQGQRDALASLIYNVGEFSFANSNLLANLNNGNYAAAASEFMIGWDTSNGVYVQGLHDRRETEFTLFTNGMVELPPIAFENPLSIPEINITPSIDTIIAEAPRLDPIAFDPTNTPVIDLSIPNPTSPGSFDQVMIDTIYVDAPIYDPPNTVPISLPEPPPVYVPPIIDFIPTFTPPNTPPVRQPPSKPPTNPQPPSPPRVPTINLPKIPPWRPPLVDTDFEPPTHSDWTGVNLPREPLGPTGPFLPPTHTDVTGTNLPPFFTPRPPTHTDTTQINLPRSPRPVIDRNTRYGVYYGDYYGGNYYGNGYYNYGRYRSGKEDNTLVYAGIGLVTILALSKIKGRG